MSEKRVHEIEHAVANTDLGVYSSIAIENDCMDAFDNNSDIIDLYELNNDSHI